MGSNSKGAQLTFLDLPALEPGKRHLFKSLRGAVWSKNKSVLIKNYMRLFLFITKHGVYIDGFAGPQNEDRAESWTAKRMLELTPQWLKKFILCDVSAPQIEALQNLKNSASEKTKKKITIISGDFNDEVRAILEGSGITAKTASFCLLDQRTFECTWATVQKIAQFKPNNKIEILYFLPISWLGRALAATKDASKVAEWWGSDPSRLRAMSTRERVEEVCDRFSVELGYKHCHAWPIRSDGENGRIMYYLIHATDHDEAPKLMHRAYRAAVGGEDIQKQMEFQFEERDRVSSGP